MAKEFTLTFLANFSKKTIHIFNTKKVNNLRRQSKVIKDKKIVFWSKMKTISTQFGTKLTI